MTSPSKITATTLLRSEDIISKPLNFERYEDLESEIKKKEIKSFIKSTASHYKDRLIEKVNLLILHFIFHSFLCMISNRQIMLQQNDLIDERANVQRILRELQNMIHEKEQKLREVTINLFNSSIFRSFKEEIKINKECPA